MPVRSLKRRSEHVRRRDGNRGQGLEPLEPRLLLSVSLELTGAQTIEPGVSINVSSKNSTQSEITLDVNPANPLNLAGFMARPGSPNIDLYYSTDGGVNWTNTVIGGSTDGLGGGSRFDPTIAFADNGDLFVGYGHANCTVSNITSVVVGRSSDGGASFDSFSVVDGNVDLNGCAGPPGVDKFHLATGPDGLGGDAVYVAYTQVGSENGSVDHRIAVAGSNDGGQTWNGPTIINDGSVGGTDQNNIYADPAVGPNGEVYVVWMNLSDDRLYLDRNLDGMFQGPLTWGTDVVVRNLVNGSFLKSPVPAAPQRGIHTGPVLDVDRSGGDHDGDLYLTFVEWANQAANDSDVKLARSSGDGGAGTWTISTVEGASSTDFLPWIDVDQTTGSVNILYYTTNGDQATGNDDIRPRLATSINGGSTFVKQYLSTMQSNEAGGYGGDYLEYIGLAVHDGTAHGLWSTRYPGGGTDLDAFTANAAFNSASDGNVMIITGRNQADLITVWRSPANDDFIEVWVNFRREFTGLASTLDFITINALDGNDFINIDDVPSSVTLTINAFGGDDTISLGEGDIDTRIQGNVTVNGGIGLDTLLLDDSDDVGSDSYTFTDSTFDKTAFGLLNYTGLEAITLDASDASNTIHVDAISADAIIINGHGGDDVITVGDGDLDSNANADITVNGGAGADELVIEDHADNVGNDTYTIGLSTFDKTSFALLTYTEIEQLTLEASAMDNTINLNASPVGTDVAIDTFVGDDTVNIGAGDIDSINGNVDVDGFLGADVVNINDQGDIGNDTYALTAGGFTKTSFAALTFANIAELALNANAFANTIDVDAVGFGVGVTVNANGGDDVINVGNGNISTSILDDLTVNGGAGADTLNLDDDGDSGDDTYTITNLAFAKTGFIGTLTYQTTEALVLNANPDDNTIDVERTAADTPVTVNANGGDDMVHVGPTQSVLFHLAAGVTVNGGGGADSFTLHDAAFVGPNDYTVSDTTVTATINGLVFAYADIEDLTLHASLADNAVDIDATDAQTPVTVFGHDGADTFHVTAPPSSMVAVHGGNPRVAPGDTLIVTGTGASDGVYGPSGGTPGDGLVTVDGVDIAFFELEPVAVSGFDSFAVVTPNGEDRLVIDALPAAGAHRLSGASRGIAFESLTFHDVGTLTLDMGAHDGSGDDDLLTINAGDLPSTGVEVLRVLSGSGDNAIMVESGVLRLDATVDAAAGGTLDVQVNNPATTVHFVATQRLDSLRIDSGAQVLLAPGGNKALVTGSLTIAGASTPTGTLNIHDNGVLVNYRDPGPSPLPLHADQIRHARDQNPGAPWTGTGITSSNAAVDPANVDVFAVEATTAFGPDGGLFFGVPVAPGDAAVLIRSTDQIAPRVVEVQVRSSAWAQAFLDHIDPGRGLGYAIPVGNKAQGDPLPWPDIDEVLLRFDEPVLVAEPDLTVTGTNQGGIAFAAVDAFAYAATTATARWRLAHGLTADRLALLLDTTATDHAGNRLDGEWVDGESTISGDGAEGGVFAFGINVLPGDLTGDGVVSIRDLQPLRRAAGSSTVERPYSALADLDGSGAVQVEDAAALRSLIGSSLPTDRLRGANAAAAADSGAIVSIIDTVRRRAAAGGRIDSGRFVAGARWERWRRSGSMLLELTVSAPEPGRTSADDAGFRSFSPGVSIADHQSA